MMELKEYIEKHTEIEWFELFWFEAEKTNPDVGHFWIKRYDIDNEYSFVGSREATLEFAENYDCWSMPDVDDPDYSYETSFGIVTLTYNPDTKRLRVVHYVDRTWQESDNWADDDTKDETVFARYEYGTWEWRRGEDRANIETYTFEEIANRLPKEEKKIRIKDVPKKYPKVQNIEIVEVRCFVDICPLYCGGASLNYLAVRRGKYIADRYDIDMDELDENYEWTLDGIGVANKEEKLEFQWLEKDTLRIVRISDNISDDLAPKVIIECDTYILKGPFDESNNPSDRIEFAF